MSTLTTAHPEAREDTALNKDSWWQRSSLRPSKLDQSKRNEKYACEHKQRDNTPFVPLDPRR